MHKVRPQQENPWTKAKNRIVSEPHTFGSEEEERVYWIGFGDAIVELGIGTQDGLRDFLHFVDRHFNFEESEPAPDLAQEKLEEEQRELEAEMEIHDDNSLGHDAEDYLLDETENDDDGEFEKSPLIEEPAPAIDKEFDDFIKKLEGGKKDERSDD